MLFSFFSLSLFLSLLLSSSTIIYLLLFSPPCNSPHCLPKSPIVRFPNLHISAHSKFPFVAKTYRKTEKKSKNSEKSETMTEYTEYINRILRFFIFPSISSFFLFYFFSPRLLLLYYLHVFYHKVDAFHFVLDKTFSIFVPSHFFPAFFSFVFSILLFVCCVLQ